MSLERRSRYNDAHGATLLAGKRSTKLNRCLGLSLRRHVAGVQLADGPCNPDKIDLDAEREMVLSMLLKMISNPNVLLLLTHVILFYKKNDQVNWRSASARISRALLLECVPLHHECRFDHVGVQQVQLTRIRALLHNCSNGSLIQNEKLFFDALSALMDALQSPVCTTKRSCALISISIMSVLVQQSGLRQILQTKIGTSPKTGGLTGLKSLVSICKMAMTSLHQSEDEDQKENIILLVQHIIDLKIESTDDVIDDVTMMTSLCTSTKLKYLMTLMTSSLTIKKPISDWSKIEKISMAVFLANESTPTQNAKILLDPSYLKILPKLIQHSDWIKRKLVSTAEGSPELVQNLINVAIQSSHWSEINFAIQLANQNEHLNSEIIISILESRNLAAIKHVIKIIEKTDKWHDLIGQIITRKKALNPVISKLKKIIRFGSHRKFNYKTFFRCKVCFE